MGLSNCTYTLSSGYSLLKLESFVFNDFKKSFILYSLVNEIEINEPKATKAAIAIIKLLTDLIFRFCITIYFWLFINNVCPLDAVEKKFP